MNKKEELLKEWNNDVLRGSAAKLANILKLNPSSVSDWLSEKKFPSEENIKNMSKIFKKSEAEIKEIFDVKGGVVQNAKNIKNNSGEINKVVHADNELLNEKLKNMDLKLDLILEKLKK
jgi:transcriptional regulator with XRE-family HTH domain